MVIKNLNRFILMLFIALIGILPAHAEMLPSVKLTLMNSLARIDEDSLSFSSLGKGRFTLQSVKNRNVRAQLTLDTTIADTVMIDISRAFIKVRFPGFRTTIGKAKVSWGEGFFYNAGDVIFGDTPLTADMTAEELRDEAVWLTSAYIPLGTYSFIEPIILVPGLNLSELMLDPEDSTPSTTDPSAGGRFVARPGGIKVEGGYLYRGAEQSHNPYLSFQGNLFLDWHLSSSISIPYYSPMISDLEESFKISWGLFHLQSLASGMSLSFRLEGLVKPCASWIEKEGDSSEYSFMLYPEISLSVNESLTYLLRSVVSPIDLSALITAGMYWNIYEGFKILSFLSVQAGETTDIYGWNKHGGIIFSCGFPFIY